MAETGTRWVPLESNPDVLNSWSRKVGLVLSQDAFTDVYGLDDELLAMVAQPAKAVVLLFPITEAYEAKRKEEDAATEAGKLPPVDPTVIWVKQTANIQRVWHIGAPSCINERKTPVERAKLLETTPLFADVHASEAQSGQSAVPRNLDTDYHFTCFVHAPSTEPGKPKGVDGHRLVELDGRRVGPIDRGPSEDLLKVRDVAAFVKERFLSQSNSVNLNMIALAPPECSSVV
ncbi:peptidase C12, ubiquitin carboxyl-terminal hydrolase 1 [Sanghuangporus baumii]|uniref:Ubiquitin carboxyl-terminal hydrolase n=1 Tax=Sanghuangporus baumii TaxID=108892 RepID=A0A9Q5HUP9_SANBA|nr:peptidase C12, ubiquitin carboxyl-terminal hydrolase 1 [Sanghuangporus baumii]